MNIIEYENVRKLDNFTKESDAFINKIISFMPKYVKEASSYVTKDKYSNVFIKGQIADHMIITISGEISVINQFESGKVFEPVTISHSDFSGIVEIILGMEEIISTNLAITDIEYIKVPKDIVLRWLNDSHDITRYVLDSVSNNFKQNMKEAGESMILDSMYIFVSYLLKNAVEGNTAYSISETRERSSIRTGINLRTLYRHIKKLKEDGFIDTHNRKILFDSSQKERLYKYYLQLRNK